MSESIEIAAAQRSGLLKDLDPPDIEGILAAGESVSFEPQQAIFETGDVGDAMYVITEGEARVDVGGRFHILKAGEFFGEMALIAPGRRMATVMAVTSVRALRIPADAFQAFLVANPNVALAMMKTLVLRLREVEQRLDAWMA